MAEVVGQDVPGYVKERKQAAADYDELLRFGSTTK
jgi:hypothetical protein